MTRRKLAGLVAAAVTALLLLARPAPATADTIVWLPASCATGEITYYSVNTWGTSDAYPAVNIAGWMQQCPGNEGQTNGFAVTYHTPSAVFVTALQPYDPLNAPAQFTLTVPYSPEAHEWWDDFGGLRGLCLVRSYGHWLSCVSIEGSADGTPSVTPVPVDDPGLLAPIVTDVPGEDSIIEAHCGTCAGDPDPWD